MSDPKYLDKPEDVQSLYEQGKYKSKRKFTIKDFQEEVRPTKWHHSFTWGAWKQNIIPMLPWVPASLSIFYLMHPFTPKEVWTPWLILFLDVIIAIAFFIYLWLPPIIAAKYRYDSSVIFMGGNALAGLERIIATYPVAVPKTPTRVKPFDFGRFTNYLKALSGILQKNIKRQHEMLRRHGVIAPEPVDPKLVDPLKTLMTAQPRRPLKLYLLQFISSANFLTGIALMITGLILPGFAIFLPLLLLAGPVCSGIGVFLFIYAFIHTIRRELPNQYLVPSTPEPAPQQKQATPEPPPEKEPKANPSLPKALTPTLPTPEELNKSKGGILTRIGLKRKKPKPKDVNTDE